MNLTRRSFLQILAAAGVAASLPNVEPILAEVVPALPPTMPPAAPEVLDGLQHLRVVFPDGTVFDLQGFVTSQLVDNPIDGMSTSEITFRPSGECKITNAPPKRKPRPRKRVAVPAQGTTIELDGQSIGDITDIQLPTMQRHTIEVTQNGMFGGEPDDHEVHVVGLRRMSDVTFTCSFDGKVHL